MKLIPIPKVNINRGAPLPIILSSDDKLKVMFYIDQVNALINAGENKALMNFEICSIEFSRTIQYKFGIPGNETLQGHPYYKMGLRSYNFYYLESSAWIKELMEIERVHPYFDELRWQNFKHYILTFHDNMFECVAVDYKISHNGEAYHDLNNILID